MNNNALRTPFTEHVGIEIPLICGAMYPCSNHELIAASSAAGGIGPYPHAHVGGPRRETAVPKMEAAATEDRLTVCGHDCDHELLRQKPLRAEVAHALFR